MLEADHLENVLTELGELRSKIAALPQNGATRIWLNLASHSLRCVSMARIACKPEVPIEFLGLSTRRLLEMSITLRFVFRERRLADLPLAAVKEHDQMCEALVKIGATLGIPSGDFVAQHRSINAGVADVLTKSKLIAKRLPQYKAMALDAGLGGEYEEFYGFLSKIAHPSPWFLGASGELLDNPAMRGILTTRAVAYAEDVSAVLQRPKMAAARELAPRLAAFRRGVSSSQRDQ